MAAASRLELPVKPGLKRIFDYLAYTISGVAVAGGAIYGLQRVPHRQATTPVASPAPVTAASGSSAPPEPSLPDAQPAPAENPAQATSDANDDTAEHAAFLQDQATLYALQKNCFDAADSNQNGDYPDLQTSACNRYTQFAYARGWDPGPLPAFGQPTPQQAPPADYSANNAQADLSAAPQTVIQAPPQVIIVDQNFAGGRAIEGHEHHLPAQSGGNSYMQPTRQIGPNYSPPPPQPQPPPQPPIQQQPSPPPQMPHPEPHNRMPTTSRPPR